MAGGVRVHARVAGSAFLRPTLPCRTMSIPYLSGNALLRPNAPGESVRQSACTGFSMIELLVALLLLAVGAISLAALQSRVLQTMQASLLQTEAQSLATDMLERIRASVAAGGSVAVYGGLIIDRVPESVRDCGLDWCSGAELAAFDMASWKCRLGAYSEHPLCAQLHATPVVAGPSRKSGLPGGAGSIRIDAEGVLRITVQWSEGRNRQRQLVIASRI